MERQPERIPLIHGIQTIGSTRGMSSHQHNPFIIIIEHTASEDKGICYGFMLMYSGNHKTEVELDQLTQKKVVFDCATYFDYTKNQAKGNAYYNAFIALTDAGELDAITMEPESLAALGQSGRLLDLNDPRCHELLEKYADRVIYYTPADGQEEGGSIPVGIDLSDSILITEYHVYEDGCALGIGAQSENIPQIEDFIEFVLQ